MTSAGSTVVDEGLHHCDSADEADRRDAYPSCSHSTSTMFSSSVETIECGIDINIGSESIELSLWPIIHVSPPRGVVGACSGRHGDST